jgi:hypothetical protein
MYSPNVQEIQVWSVWDAEPFYRGMGFKSVWNVSDGTGKKSKRVEGAWGPLLMWTNDRLRLRDPAQTLLRPVESFPNLKSRDSNVTLKSKDSNLSLKGPGTYQNKTNL